MAIFKMSTPSGSAVVYNRAKKALATKKDSQCLFLFCFLSVCHLIKS